jgi:hypothetical protein
MLFVKKSKELKAQTERTKLDKKPFVNSEEKQGCQMVYLNAKNG